MSGPLRSRKSPREIKMSNGQGAYFGRNAKRHGGEFYFSTDSGVWDEASVSIPEGERKKFARFLRRFADRLDPEDA